MTGTTGAPLDAGREAIGRYAWREGYELFSEADASGGLTPRGPRALADLQRRLAAHRHEHGFAPRVRVGLHATAHGDEIVASRDTLEARRTPLPVSGPREVELKGIAAPVEVVSVDWP